MHFLYQCWGCLIFDLSLGGCGLRHNDVWERSASSKEVVAFATMTGGLRYYDALPSLR